MGNSWSSLESYEYRVVLSVTCPSSRGMVSVNFSIERLVIYSIDFAAHTDDVGSARCAHLKIFESDYSRLPFFCGSSHLAIIEWRYNDISRVYGRIFRLN